MPLLFSLCNMPHWRQPRWNLQTFVVSQIGEVTWFLATLFVFRIRVPRPCSEPERNQTSEMRRIGEDWADRRLESLCLAGIW